MTVEERIQKIQQLLREEACSAWLFYDFRGSDPIAYRVLGLDAGAHTTRRWFYLVPAEGNPVKLVHRIEAARLDPLPGERRIYLQWQSLRRGLCDMVAPHPQVAMQYSPEAAIPYVSRVDAGTVELVRAAGAEVVSAGDLLQHLECVWSAEQLASHRRAAGHLARIVREIFNWIASRLRAGTATTEQQVQHRLLEEMKGVKLVTDFPPIVAVGSHAGDPHYAPELGQETPIEPDRLVLVDIWAKDSLPGSVYADITWTAFYGAEVADHVRRVFEVVREARDAGVAFLRERLRTGQTVRGYEVDNAVRSVIEKAGFGEAFIHRTGHNLGEEVHGNGVHFDDLETHDNRRVISGIACTVEPGIYLPDFGIRNEIDVYLHPDDVEVTTETQDKLWHFRV